MGIREFAYADVVLNASFYGQWMLCRIFGVERSIIQILWFWTCFYITVTQSVVSLVLCSAFFFYVYYPAIAQDKIFPYTKTKSIWNVKHSIKT